MTNEQKSSRGYVIHRQADDGTLLYARFDEGGVHWVGSKAMACHFLRLSDADQVAYGEDCDGVTYGVGDKETQGEDQ